MWLLYTIEIASHIFRLIMAGEALASASMTPKTGAPTQLSQPELNEIIAKHELWRRSRPGGARAQLANFDMSYLTFRGHDLTEVDFTGSVMLEGNMEGAKLDMCIFFGCDLRKSNFRDASLIKADFRGATLNGAVMVGADLTSADMREGSYATYDPEKGLSFAAEKEAWANGVGGVDLRGTNMGSVKLSGAVATNSNFEDANLTKARIIGSNLTGANLAGANLSGADFSNCELKNVNLRGANLSGVMMDFGNLVNVDMTGALTDKPAGKTLNQLPVPLEELLRLHAEWLRSKSVGGKKLDLSGFDIRGIPSLARADLTMIVAEKSVWYGLDMTRINMQAAQFKGSDMRSCNFEMADLRGSDFSKANLVGTKFVKARLEPLLFDEKRLLKTSFSRANLRYANFTEAVLNDADFSDADLSFADFTGADLRGARLDNTIREETKIDLDKVNQVVVKRGH